MRASLTFAIMLSLTMFVHSGAGATDATKSLEQENEELKKTVASKNKIIAELRLQLESREQELATLRRRYGITNGEGTAEVKEGRVLINEPYLGVYLGESVESLKKRFTVTKAGHDTFGVAPVESAFSEMRVFAYQGYIYRIQCKAKTGTRDTIKNALIAKYKLKNGQTDKPSPVKLAFAAGTRDKPTEIVFWDDVTTEDTTTFVAYTHVKLKEQKDHEDQTQQAIRQRVKQEQL